MLVPHSQHDPRGGDPVGWSGGDRWRRLLGGQGRGHPADRGGTARRVRRVVRSLAGRLRRPVRRGGTSRRPVGEARARAGRDCGGGRNGGWSRLVAWPGCVVAQRGHGHGFDTIHRVSRVRHARRPGAARDRGTPDESASPSLAHLAIGHRHRLCSADGRRWRSGERRRTAARGADRDRGAGWLVLGVVMATAGGGQ